MARTVVTSLVAAVVATVVIVGSALAEAPEVTYQFPPNDAVLQERPPAIQLCFREPIDVRDLDKGGDFRFTVRGADGMLLGHRAIFQPDGYGVVVQPGIPSESQGAWTFEWRVRDRETEDPSDGAIRFTVEEGGDAVIPADPPPCTSDTTPAAEESPRSTGDSVEPNGPTLEDDDGPDVLLLALLTTGAAGAAGVIALIGYVVRQRTGFWLHRPPARRDDDAPHH
jgi:methionine-rich copper-binding protein CopC